MTSRRPVHMLGLLALATPVLGFAQAQATNKPDDKFRYAFGAGASYASGNTNASSVNLSGDAVKATASDKWHVDGKANYGRTDGVTTVENLSLDGEYDKDFTPLYFGFGKADYLRDRPANVSTRASLFGGVGRHMAKTDTTTFDLTLGAGYTQDRYFDPSLIDGEYRSSFGRAELLLGEESSHKWTPTTTFHQKLQLFPALRSGGGYRGEFDSGLSVAMTSTLSLTASLTYRYDSDPGVGLKKGDTLFVTGITVKLD